MRARAAGRLTRSWPRSFPSLRCAVPRPLVRIESVTRVGPCGADRQVPARFTVGILSLAMPDPGPGRPPARDRTNARVVRCATDGPSRPVRDRAGVEADMAGDEDELLASALGTVGASTGGRGAQRGASFASRFLKTVAHEVGMTLPLSLEAATERLTTIFAELGRVLDQPPQPGAGRRRIRAVAGGGAGGLNPVVITVDLEPGAVGGTSIALRAEAKEGIIKQRSAEKMTKMIVDRLASHSGERG